MRRLLKIMKSGLVGEIWEYLEINEHPEDWTLLRVRRHFDGIFFFNGQMNFFILAVLQAQFFPLSCLLATFYGIKVARI